MRNVTDSSRSASGQFQQVVAAFLAQPGLPFAGVLAAERVERVFAKHDNLFGRSAIYSTAVMVWSFLSQVLRDGKDASCQAGGGARRQLLWATGSRLANVGYR